MTLDPFRPFFSADERSGGEGDLLELLDQALQSGETRLIVGAVANMAKAEGMTAVSRKSGIPRSKLYRMLGEYGDPSLSDLLRLLAAMGVQLRARPAPRREAQA